MHVSRIYMKNYRSILELDLRLSEGKNVIVGRNNVGKSNVVRALDLLLGERNPAWERSENVNESDFYTWKEPLAGGGVEVRSASEFFIWCELERGEAESLNYDEMYKCPGFYVYSRITDWEQVGGRNRPVKESVRVDKDTLPTGYSTIFEITEDTNADREYVNPKRRDDDCLEKQFADKHCFALAFRAQITEGGEIEKDIRFLYREDTSSHWVLAFKAPIRNELLQSAIIPSFRDPSSQLRLANWTWYGKLMKHLTQGCEKSGDYQGALAEVKSVADKMFAQLKTTVMKSSIEVAFPGTTIDFQFNADKGDDLYKNCLIYIDDGFKSLLADKGSGIQSATVIGLFNYYTRHVNAVGSSLLCIEEPEIYLHPHAQRVISNRLDDFLENNRNQVIMTTHSAEFIRTAINDLNVILLRKRERNTRALTVELAEFKHLLVGDAREMFFAEKVIVCEGLDHYVLMAVAEEIFPRKLDEQNISIVSASGKDRISQLVRLVLKVGINCFVLADFDYLIRDRDEEKCKKHGAKAHESVQSLGEAFFSQPCIFADKGKKEYAQIQALRACLKKDEEAAYYTAKTAASFKTIDLSEVLGKLRNNGICILSAEVEAFSKDMSFVSPDNKLTLEKVYELGARIAGGEKATDLFDTAEIAEFLSTVFQR